MYVETVPNRGARPTILLRVGKRRGKKTDKQTLANLSHWPKEQVEALRQVLRGRRLVPLDEQFRVERSLPHGHVEAVLSVMRKLEMEGLIASRPCPQRDLVAAMIAQRILDPGSKLENTRQWLATSLAEEVGVEGADADDLYAAMDWLFPRRERIEKKLAKRHLREGARVLYDLSSSSYTGSCCPLAFRGKNRDEEDLPCIAYGLLADAEGRPIAIEVYPGNTGDPSTVADQVEKLRDRFELTRVVLVGDRGMLTDARIEALRKRPQLGWISALRAPAIQGLIERKELQMSLFDEQNLAEIHSAAHPGERLIVCYNPLLFEDRRRTRDELLAGTEKLLEGVAKDVRRRTKTPLEADEIGLKAGRVLNRFKVGKHFELQIADNFFAYARKTAAIEREARLDGLYVIRTSEPERDLSAEDTVRTYKSLGQVEQAFRCLKGLDLRVRPIYHRTVQRVQTHFFICMLAYYVERHMREDLASILFEDEELGEARWRRDPVAKAEPSESAKRKKAARQTEDGWPVHSFQSLLTELATRCKNTCRVGEGKHAVQVTMLTEPTDFQRHVFELLGIKT